MKIKKIFLVVIAMITVMLSLVACSRDETGSSNMVDNPSSHQHIYVDGVCIVCGGGEYLPSVYDVLVDYISNNEEEVIGQYILSYNVGDYDFLTFTYVILEKTLEINYAQNTGSQQYNISIWIESIDDGIYDYVYKEQSNYIYGVVNAYEFNSSTRLSHRSTNFVNNITDYKMRATSGIERLLAVFNNFTEEKNLDISAKDLGFSYNS